jgi:hypothetical protein
MSIKLRGKERSGLRRCGMINQYNGLASITQPNFVFFEFENYECFSEFRILASGHEHRDCSDQRIALVMITILGFVLEGAC